MCLAQKLCSRDETQRDGVQELEDAEGKGAQETLLRSLGTPRQDLQLLWLRASECQGRIPGVGGLRVGFKTILPGPASAGFVAITPRVQDAPGPFPAASSESGTEPGRCSMNNRMAVPLATRRGVWPQA